MSNINEMQDHEHPISEEIKEEMDTGKGRWNTKTEVDCIMSDNPSTVTYVTVIINASILEASIIKKNDGNGLRFVNHHCYTRAPKQEYTNKG